MLAAAPVQPHERIASLDILRAFALLGILVVNMLSFNASFWSTVPIEKIWPAWWDRAASWIIAALFAGKFNSLFAFLFGVGFTIQLERLAARGPGFSWIYLRRLLVLFLFGLGHAFFIWTGDVLHIYSALGVFLLLLRRVPNKVVLGLILAGLLLPAVFGTIRVLRYTPAKAEQDKTMITSMAEATNRAYGRGTYLEATRMRIQEMKFMYSDPRWYFFYPTLFLTILLGFYVGRKRYIQEAALRLDFIRKVQRWSLGVGLTCGVTFAVARLYTVPFQPTMLNVLVGTAFAFARPSLMLFYATTLALMAQSPRWGPRLAPLAAVGRMPLTNYLLQSVVCTLIFYGYGLGFFNRCGPALGLLLSFAIFAAQIPWSNWWFRRWQFGPAEWLWRAVTYGAAPAMRRQVAAAVAS